LPNISSRVNGNSLNISDIEEPEIGQLAFYCTNEKKDLKLELVDFKVFLKEKKGPLDIKGLTQAIKVLFDDARHDALDKNDNINNIYIPFSKENLIQDFDQDFNGWMDIYNYVLKKPTKGHQKIYSLTVQAVPI
jgi:hypothetical protein